MIVSINQPAYLPWLGYFERIAKSDLHIVLDHVQYEKNSFINRNRVKTTNGWCWLTVPVKTKGKFNNLDINTVEISNDVNWAKKHWQTLYQNYSKAPYFHDHAQFFDSLYQRQWYYLADLCKEVTTYFLKTLRISTPLSFSSEMNPLACKDRLILNLCQQTQATTYLSGALGRNYLNEALFGQAGIKVIYQSFDHPQYPQSQPGPFESHLSIIDLVFNCGPKSLEILLGEKG